MLEADFLTMATTTVRVEPLSTHNDYGNPVFGTATTYPARVEDISVLDARGQVREDVPRWVVYVMSSSAEINPSDRITLRGSLTPRIHRVIRDDDEDGQHHLEVECS